MTATATRPLEILLQTTIPYAEDDWHIGRFALLRDYIAGLTNPDGTPLARVTARDREPDANGDDPVLSAIDDSAYDQVWLFGVDSGGETGISAAECKALSAFRARGGAIFATRDHQDLGSSLCNLGGIGAAHFFHSEQPDPDPARNARDDPFTTDIDYPNYHSGDNGDVQTVRAAEPLHPVLRGDDGPLARLPAHPHEGGVGKPAGDESARVVVTGTSAATRRPFNIAVAFEAADGNGRGWAESTFHHFCDYNWDVSAGCPSFVSEKPSAAIARDPALLDDTKRYVRNLVAWLGRRPR
ncbi:MAG: hypothetical protein QOI11_1029 [Candidatus Eremiobacteraeota bacterium]|jgi:hypothetical protein|nr:hypothetical protein [Candidatus Eremiobacteraeota bacterium]